MLSLQHLYINMDKELLHRYVQGTVSDAEIEQVVEWLDRDPAHVREFMALQRLNDLTVANRVDKQKVLPGARSLRIRRFFTEFARIAAVAAAVLVTDRLVMTIRQEPVGPIAMQTVRVPAGQRVELELPDKTHVWLNAQSTLTYPVYFGKNNREVTLDGEAFFNVEADPASPFRVNTSVADVVVTGTEFNVASRSDSDIMSVALLDGVVSLYSPEEDGPLLYTMNRGEHVLVSGGRLEVAAIENIDYFRWREGLLCFSNETVSNIFKKLELYYDIKIDVQRRNLLQRRYTGKFRTKDGIEHVLKTLQMEHRFTFVRNEETNRITIK